MRDQVAHRLCVPAVPAWLRPTAGDPHFLADRGVIRRKMYILGLYCSHEPVQRLTLERVWPRSAMLGVVQHLTGAEPGAPCS